MTGRGFTLLETLVALLIFALIAAGGAGLTRGALSAQAAVGDGHDDLARLWTARALMRADFAQLVGRSTRGVFDGARRPALHGGPPDLDGTILSLVRGGWANYAGAPRPDLQSVSYALIEDRLVRRTRPRLDPTPQTPVVETTLLDGVGDVNVRFFVGGVWVDRWGVNASGGFQTTARTPEAIEWVVEVEGLGEVRQLFWIGAAGA